MARGQARNSHRHGGVGHGPPRQGKGEKLNKCIQGTQYRGWEGTGRQAKGSGEQAEMKSQR